MKEKLKDFIINEKIRYINGFLNALALAIFNFLKNLFEKNI